MNRREFIQNTSLVTAGLICAPAATFAADTTPAFPVVRIPEAQRKFKSAAVERAIRQIQSSIGNKELAWMFGNCFPNTLDTTVDFGEIDGRPDTYVITGDIDAMWLRDSSAQVWPYLPLMKDDHALQQLIAGVINRQVRCILKDPYANAFYKDENKISQWASDRTEMKPGVHERKWEVDSLCYPLRLAYAYWRTSHDTAPFDPAWRQAVLLIVQTFRQQQRKNGRGPYHWQRDGSPVDPYGNPVKPVGLIFSMFGPSDDPTKYPFLVPSNFFAVVSLRQAAEILEKIYHDTAGAAQCRSLAQEVEDALKQYAVLDHAPSGTIFAVQLDGLGNTAFSDDSNVPSLLSLPYLQAVQSTDPVYQATREFVLSRNNPFYFKGKFAFGPGSSHTASGFIWPIGLTMQALTSTDDSEISSCLKMLQATHAGTGFMHESFNCDDPSKFTRSWFAWANSLFGELILKVYLEHPGLLN
ncbi:MAG TPA: glycoside hydrolase family 125 protein [Candidatus Methylacidiphilales bacterium]|jgi:meiotically up-regulated gene 157 (Mug157) protein|nr:glycoside hydrolase family 125 protein [Candidatus Methylacidiphilales bacterium]